LACKPLRPLQEKGGSREVEAGKKGERKTLRPNAAWSPLPLGNIPWEGKEEGRGLSANSVVSLARTSSFGGREEKEEPNSSLTLGLIPIPLWRVESSFLEKRKPFSSLVFEIRSSSQGRRKKGESLVYALGKRRGGGGDHRRPLSPFGKGGEDRSLFREERKGEAPQPLRSLLVFL